MKRPSPQSQSLALVTNNQIDSASRARDLDRLRVLLPGLAHTANADVQAYALAYVERYQGDVLQLEQEWAFLTAALAQARQREEDAVVVRLVAGLAHPAGRLANLAEAEYILRLGIEASRRAHDQAHLAAFSNRLSGLLFARGKYQEGWHLWNSSLELAGPAACAPAFWEPLASFAYIADAYLADTLGAAATPRFMPIIQSACQSQDPESFVVARFVRGFHARLMNDSRRAYEDLSACLRSLAFQASDAPPSPHRQLLMLVAQAELARAEGDYARSQSYTETGIALAQVFSDRYTVAALLIDQGLYTHRQGRFADMRAAYLRLRALALQTETPRIHHYSRLFGQILAECAPESASATLPLPGASASPTLLESISEREREVLELVAAGLSNQDIARRLVITPGTVKKHLEHIYTKFDVHSRTAALARARKLDLLD